MALAVQVQLNPRTKPILPTAKANKLLQYRRRKWREGEVPVSKHQTQLGCVRWESRRGVGEPNCRCETETSDDASGDKKARIHSYVETATKIKKALVRKQRCRGTAKRCAARRQASSDPHQAHRRGALYRYPQYADDGCGWQTRRGPSS